MIVKQSRQRNAILSFLKTRKDHPTAEVVYLNVKTEFPNISLGTVYRNLTQLSDSGVIRRLSYGELGVDHFDADISQHHHFICDNCKCVLDLEMEPITFLDEEANKNFSGCILGHNIYFHGVCPDCIKQQNK
jgi:Fur family peroxide stress response transcriptional regulator